MLGRASSAVSSSSSPFRHLPDDIQDFLTDYPRLSKSVPSGLKKSFSSPSLSEPNVNLEFYQNKIKCKPDKLKIDDLHEQWAGDYETLEYQHGFIQWLFPTQEHGANFRAQPLQVHERDVMCESTEIQSRVIKSYQLMLDFYGMELLNQETGLLRRVVLPKRYSQRYTNLVRAQHNNLRISRILKSLSELGLERLNAGFLLHVLNEQSEHGQLSSWGLIDSMDRWWVNCLRNEEERLWIGKVVSKVRKRGPLTSGGQRIFSRELYERALENRERTGKLSLELALDEE